MQAAHLFWAGRTVLVTGANGFLGSWLCHALVDDGAQVVGLIRDDLPLSYLQVTGTIRSVTAVHGSLTDYATLERTLNEFEVDTCFHLGAQAIVTTAERLPLSTFDSNIAGTYTLLEAARRYGRLRALVVASSDKVYGDQRNLPYTEETPLLGINPYDVSKVCTDLLTQSYVRTYGLPAAISRCGNLYGPGDLNFSRVVPGTIRSLVRGERPEIRSDGTYLRDYFFVGDAASALVALAEAIDRPAVRGQAFNFGTETPTRVLDVVRELTLLANRPDLEPIIRNEAKREIKAQYLSCERARQALGWRHKVDLKEGLAASQHWYERFLREHAKAFDRAPATS